MTAQDLPVDSVVPPAGAGTSTCLICGTPTTTPSQRLSGVVAPWLLCPGHQRRLRLHLERWLEVERRRAARDDRPFLSDPDCRRLRRGEDPVLIREWCHEYGIPVASSGSLSSMALRAYRMAHGEAREQD